MNEIRFFSDKDPVEQRGFRTIYTGPAHPPFGKLRLGLVFSTLGYSPVTWRVFNAVAGAFERLFVEKMRQQKVGNRSIPA